MLKNNFEILELCERENLIDVETKYYNMYKPVYCMQSPKQDVRFYSKEWIQRCKEGWINKSQESKEKALKNLTKGKGGRFDKKSIVLGFLGFENISSGVPCSTIFPLSINKILSPTSLANPIS